MSDRPPRISRWETVANRIKLLVRRVLGMHEQRRTSTYRPVGRRERHDRE